MKLVKVKQYFIETKKMISVNSPLKRGIRPACRISSRRDGRQGCVIKNLIIFLSLIVRISINSKQLIYINQAK